MFTRVINGVVKMIEDPNCKSGFNKLPQCFKDLMYILQVDYEFSFDENDNDYQEFINKYKNIIGAKTEYPDITDDECKDAAIKFMCYRQIIYCYEHQKEERPHQKLSEDQQNEYDLIVKREDEIASVLYETLDSENINEESQYTRNIAITFFTSYSKNKFILPGKYYYPR